MLGEVFRLEIDGATACDEHTSNVQIGASKCGESEQIALLGGDRRSMDETMT